MADKAFIHILDKAGKKTEDSIKVMYNPTEYSISTTAEIKNKGSNIQFKRVNVDDFTVTLFFDTYEDGTDVRDQINKIAKLVVPTVEKKKTKQPSLCLFCWGKFTYKGIIYKIVRKFTMFDDSGTPVRANVTVTFKSVITKKEDAEFKGKVACRKLWTVKTGDRLDLIAHSALLDVNHWRKIAEENSILDPMRFPAPEDIGRTIFIPDTY